MSSASFSEGDRRTDVSSEVGRPLVTIGLTAFNSVETIRQAVDSALKQNWRPIEVVAVDDCSSDGTGELLVCFAETVPELRVFRNSDNCGVAVSRNRILSEARGDFVAFFDDDDVSLPTRIEAQLNRIVEYEARFSETVLVICHTAREIHYPSGTVRTEPTMGQELGVRAPSGVAVARRILMGAPLKDGYGACATCSQMARISTYRLIGGFDPQLRRGEDTDFNIRLAEAGGHFVGISEPLVTQIMTPTSEKSLAEEYRNMRILIEKHRPLMERDGQYEFSLRWLDLKQAWLEQKFISFVRLFALLALRHPLLSAHRLAHALPNIGSNLAFSRFHRHRNSVSDTRHLDR
jgi:GT2 family glycosyltransferase